MSGPKAWHPMDANLEPPAEPEFKREYHCEWPEEPEAVVGVDHAAGPDETVTEIAYAAPTVQTWTACEVFVNGLSLGKMDATFSHSPPDPPTFDEIARACRNMRKAARRRLR